MRTVSPRWTPAAGRGVVLAVGFAIMLGACGAVCCAGVWQWLDRVAGLP
jgi:hypothetical protein